MAKVAKKNTNQDEKVLEQSEVLTETDVTEAAIDAAEQAGTVIAEKRGTEPVADVEDRETRAVAKAGKRSAKALAEQDAKAAKQARQADGDPSSEETGASPKSTAKPPRSRLERRSKNFRQAAEQIEAGKNYALRPAIELAQKTSPVKFDATVEIHLRLNVDPRQADQNLRDTIVLPAGTGKTVRVAVFAEPDVAKAADAAGADVAGSDEFLQQLDKEQLDFDVLIATPSQMAKLGKYARLLGPKGLMPNPKSGTVTNDVAKAVKEAKAGRVEYRVDSTGIVHVGIGKVSFQADDLLANAQILIGNIKASKPSSIKGSFIKSAHLSTSMGPSIALDIASL